jgi:hypothetical protein
MFVLNKLTKRTTMSPRLRPCSHSPYILAALLAALLLPGPVWAGDFIDTRVSFTLGDDNFLKSAGQQIPDSPVLGIGDREGYELPFDNLDLATTGRENELHLVLYKKMEGILPGLTTEAAMAMEIDMAALELGQGVGRVFSDDSSYIRLTYAIDAARRGERYLDVVLFPLSGDRFRVGYLYDLTWGGADMFPRKKGPTPAFKIGGNHGIFYWWSGMKMVLAQTELSESATEQGTTLQTSENETLYSVLAGVGTQPVEGLSIDLSGGYIQMARNPIEDVAGEHVTATGFSARVAYGKGLNVGLSSDLRLLRNDPEFLESLGRRPSYNPGGGLSWRVAVEGNAIAQVLADPDLYGGTTRLWATAAAVDMRLQLNYLRINLTGVYRSLQFSLLNTPSFVPFTAFNEEAIIQPQIFAAISTDYHLPDWALTPGIQLGVELPGAVKTELFGKTGPNATPTLIGENTLLVRTSGERVILPEGEGRLPIISGRLTFRWYPSDMLTILAYALFAFDQNTSILEINADLTKSRIFDDPVRFGAGVTAQARF